ncbi:deoxycytidine deaminase [Clostridium botulinum]|uniref:deoxycytidine deaminase n=1 Tax=Clostridium TaxID=1485 RepID=UPI0005056DE0|nr:deoxycytidine deaminase [Clostridium sp. ZBS12]KFX56021.1 deoxycytidine deaminase [Clostridium botulinum]MBY6804199.1 deoxycytidine deaminase [Clostridium botulinum]MBY6813162.1 deoxycytidine deaminase [Clostridium botulinum]MBY6821661.1 deoxycytidine deaminase [Clostridium botulinum]NFJ49781.1 deoxycytidine deaminase [Clostridium botulinum]
MLSIVDIQKELGKGINLVPFRDKNIKENSINLSASCYAWTMSNGNVFRNGDRWILGGDNNEKKCTGENFKLLKGKSAVYEINGKKEIILLPFATTLIETEEVLAVGNNIGGTYHSKVGLVSQGLGHIGTMLGPNFSGHSLIAIHNVSKEVLTIEIGETFISVAFNYLTTPIATNNATRNGHLEKLSELGVQLDTKEREVLDEDWKSSTIRVREKLKEDKNFKQYEDTLQRKKYENLKKYINKNNIIISVGIIALIAIFYLLASITDSKLDKPIWVDRFWTVGFSGIFIVVFNPLIKLMKPSQ